MRAVPIVVTFLLLGAGGALAAAQTSQQGECDYLGDWRTQATPITTGGPPLWAYADVGACASVHIVEGAGTRADYDLRADVVDPEMSRYVVKYGAGGFTSTFACGGGETAWCELGPFHGWTSPRPACAKVEIWKDGALFRQAKACV